MQLFRPKYEVEEILNSLRPVLESGWTGPGPKCKEFEKKFNEVIGSKYSHLVNSATAALHLAVRLCDLPKGSKVLTTPLTFVSTNAVILYEGLEPVFVDINDQDLSLDVNDLFKKQKQHDAKAVLWVHYGGHASSYFDSLMQLKGPDLKVIEDCAHAAGSFYSNGQRVGSNKETYSCFSFQAVKNCPTADSGIIVLPDKMTYERAKKLAWLGIDKDTYARTQSEARQLYKWKYDVPELGYKYNGNDVMASIALTQFKYLDRDNAYRKQICDWYESNFLQYADKVKIVHQCKDSSHHLFVIRVKNREDVIEALKKNGISPGVHYLPNYEFAPLKRFYKGGQCPNTERISQEILSLPNHLLLTKSDIDKICEVVINAIRN